MNKILARRRNEQQRLIEVARVYVEALGGRIPIVAAVVVGSAARGDFNVWSDIDVVVISEALPDRIPDRSAMLMDEAPAGVQAVGFTRAEFRRAHARANPMAIEAAAGGKILAGEDFIKQFR